MKAAYEEIMDFVTSSPSLEAILAYTHSKATLDRVDYLLSLAEADRISEAEDAELREFLRAIDVMEELKIRARKRLGIAED